MNKILSAIFATVFSVSAFAKDINVVITGKQGGSSYARTIALAEYLESQGYTVNLVKSFNARKALRWFEQSKEPTVMAMVDSAFLEAPEHSLESQHVGVIEYESYLYVCGKAGSNGETKLSWRADYPAKLETFLEGVYKTDIKPIPYDSGSAELESLIAGDTDLMVTSVKRASKAVAQGFKCNYYTGIDDDVTFASLSLRKLNNDPLSSLSFTFFSMMKNIDNADEFRSLLKKHVSDPKYVEYIKGRKALPFDASNWDNNKTHKYIQGQINNWTN
jgi:hypothetical protein